MQVKYQIEKMEICKWWLDRGFYLLPAQVGKKYLLQGWGEHKSKVTTFEGAVQMFDTKQSSINIAILASDRHCVLDFDNPDLYTYWANKHPEIAHTYTERTPRGGAHVFLFAQVPQNLCLVEGVELKRVCLVHPSQVDGRQYTRGEAEIIEANPERVFSSIGKPGHKTARLLIVENSPHSSRSNGGSVISQIKDHWRTLDVFRTYRPDIEFKIKSGIASCRCPFHDDKRPSMFVVIETGFWKCHGCGAFGDVIDAYARLQGIDNREAVGRMSQALRVRS